VPDDVPLLRGVDRVAAVAVGTAVRLVLQHAAHVGVTDLDAKGLFERYRPYDQHTYRR
jgi:hypothetical protein